MKYIKHFFIVCVAFSLMVMAGCTDQWEDRTDATDPSVSDKTLLQLIQEDSDLSDFLEILQKTEYAQILAGTGVGTSGMTVFAPTNEALQNFNMYATDDVLLAFIRTHISLTSNITGIAGDQKWVKMANGKGFSFDPEERTIDGLSLIGGNNVGKNGVLQKLDGILTSRPSIWEFMGQKSFAQTEVARELMDYTMFDESSEIIRYTPEGEAVYDSLFFDLSAYTENLPVDNEDSLYIYVVLADDAYAAHHARYRRILNQIRLDESPYPVGTDSMTSLHLNMDLTFRVDKVDGEFCYDLHPVMKSVQGVNVYFNPSDIIEERMLSNGKLYVVQNCQIPLANNKIKPIWIEGESSNRQPYGDFPGDSISTKLVRIRSWASNGKVLFYNNRHFRFRPVVFSVPYKFFWRIGNDEATDTVPMRQRLYISNPGAIMVSPNNSMVTPLMGTTTANGHVRYNTLDPAYPDRATYPTLTDQVTTYYFFSAVQDTLRDARWTISAADTASRVGWTRAISAAYKVTDGYTYISTNPAPVVTNNPLTDDQIARVRNGETIDVGWRARPDYLTEKQLFFSTMTFPVKRDGFSAVTTPSVEDLARIDVDYNIDSYTFLSYGNAGLAVNRDFRARNNFWAQRVSWSNAATPVLTFTDLRGVYLDYMRLEPILDDYEGFPTEDE